MTTARYLLSEAVDNIKANRTTTVTAVITTAFTIQNGQMFLGPAKLGKAPRIAWE